MKYYLKLIAVSFAILFLELLLIRLISTEIRIFAYFSNLLLLAIFVGSGLGMLIKKRLSITFSSGLLLIITAIVALGWMARITDLLAPLSESFFWFQTNSSSLGGIIGGLAMTLLLFFMTMGVFVPLGQSLGELLEDTNKLILAYSVNVIASLAGMWIFQSISLLKISLYAGLALSQLLLIFLVDKWPQKKFVSFCLVLTLVLFIASYAQDENSHSQTVWSPYQKLTLTPIPENDQWSKGYVLKVNNVGYMGLLDLSDAFKKSVADKYQNQQLPAGVDLRFSDQYVFPFLLHPESRDVLIVGAGGGNDAAAAVRAGVANIDAVEIDPQIIEFGKKYHPEKPYDSKSVTVYNDDGRSFFKQSKKQYDIIIMGLADSHTLTSSLTNVRLDNYLYTEESLREIKNLLKPDGLLFLSFEVNRDWIGSRIQKGLTDVFQTKPMTFSMKDNNYFSWGGTIFVAGKNLAGLNAALDKNPDLKQFIDSRLVDFPQNIKPLTDNWPFLYLDHPRLPAIHLLIYLLLILFVFFFRKTVEWQGRFRWDFFFLGAGFLLYEFQNISKTSLLFGNTWVTNLFTISSILIFILLANLIQAKKPLPLKVAYALLVASIIVQFFIPLSSFNSLPFYAKALVVSLILNLPFLFSGLIFIAKLDRATSKSAAFASNLLGSALGGMLEIFAFLFGIQSLLVFSLVLYVCAIIPLEKIPILNKVFKSA